MPSFLAKLKSWQLNLKLTSPKRLRQLGVLSLNERNLSCISQHNPRANFPLVDNKLTTKLLAQDYQLATPQLIGVLRHHAQIKQLPSLLAAYSQAGFVIKPAQGSGGKGILVIKQHSSSGFIKSSGELISFSEVEKHLSNLLSGLYSLGGNPDIALIESLVQGAPEFERFSYAGVPDIRVIVYQGYPVMAMMRLSTQASDGKANLHQGALGVGIKLSDGSAVQAVQYNRPINIHPDTGVTLAELKLENFTYLLELAASSYEMTGLGYLGVDLVIDAKQGPLLLELNARPGLAIQMANKQGLKPRLAAVNSRLEQRSTSIQTPQQRTAWAQAAFN